MKKTLTILVVCLFTLNTQAQKKVTKFSIAAESAVMATKQAYQAYNLGFGGSGKIQFPTGKKNYFTGNLGVVAFSGRSGPANEIFKDLGAGTLPEPYNAYIKNINVATPGLTIIPVKLGYEYFTNKTFHIGVEGGYTFAIVKKVTESITGDVSGINFSVGAGFLIAKKLDIGMRYEQWRTTSSQKDYTSFVGLRTLLMLDFSK